MTPEESEPQLVKSEGAVASLAVLSHELRTPLTSIVGYVELLLAGEAGPLTERQRRHLETIERNAKRLARATVEIEFLAQQNPEQA